MAELVPLAFLFRGHFRRHSDISLPTFLVYIAIGDFFANLAQAIGLNMLVLKLDITQILILFVWQWVMAIVIGGPMPSALKASASRTPGGRLSFTTSR